jgi:hypothetical protein
MTIQTHNSTDSCIAEIHSGEELVSSVEKGGDLLADLYYQGFDRIILSVHHLSPQFFDLKTGFAGELLQKFANFHMQLVIVGDVTPFSNDRFDEFIGESNKGFQVNFAKDVKEVLQSC